MDGGNCSCGCAFVDITSETVYTGSAGHFEGSIELSKVFRVEDKAVGQRLKGIEAGDVGGQA